MLRRVQAAQDFVAAQILVSGFRRFLCWPFRLAAFQPLACPYP